MKPSLLTALCLTSVVGCVPPNAVSMDEGQGIPLTTQVVGAKTSPLRVEGDTLYFLHAPPDKVKPKDFKDPKAIDAHYTALSAALKKRNPVQDARFAFNNSMRYFFTTNGRAATGVFNLGLPELAKLCPKASTRIAYLEGYKFTEYSGECLADSKPCNNYAYQVSETYMLPWNKEMARLCESGK